MEPVVLTARVRWDGDRYIASIDGLVLEAEGETVGEAQDELIDMMRTWIEIHDGKSALEQTLAEAGFPGVDEDTELQLEFVDEVAIQVQEELPAQ